MAAAAAERTVYAYNQNGKTLVFAANVLIQAARHDIDNATQIASANLTIYGLILATIAAVCVLGAIGLAISIGRDLGGSGRKRNRRPNDGRPARIPGRPS